MIDLNEASKAYAVSVNELNAARNREDQARAASLEAYNRRDAMKEQLLTASFNKTFRHD